MRFGVYGADRAQVDFTRACRRIGLLAGLGLFVLAAGSAAASAPDDPLFPQQWALVRPDVLGAAQAWQQSTGEGVTVAILDTGADLGHPDLAGALWTNPGEVAGNGLDDDHDGYVDDVHGVDLVNGDGDPSDDEGHGTHVAGVVAERAGNHIGGVGLAYGAQVMVIKVLDSQRAGDANDIATGIRYALAHGARIVNASINGDGVSRVLQTALGEASAAGALVVCSAGNDARDIDAVPSYPASYPDASVIAVAAESRDGSLPSFSNRGATTVDVAAPGEDILSTALGGGYELRSGTSTAAPFVTATLALMSSAAPGLGGAALKSALLGAARPAPPVSVAAPNVPAGTSVPAVPGDPAVPAGPVGGVIAPPNLDTAAAVRAVAAEPGVHAASTPLALRALSPGRAKGGAVLRWFASGDAATVTGLQVLVDGVVAGKRPVGARSRLTVRARPGRHRWNVRAVDASGAVLVQAGGAFTVPRARHSAHRGVRS